MDNGWIKIYRKLRDKGYYKKSQFIHLWIELLFLSQHKDKEFFWNGKVQKLEKGQFLTGRKALSEATGIPETTVEDILKIFEKELQIRQQKTTKFRLITILNWESYQNSDNRATTDRQQADTYKNVRIKECKKNTLSQSDEVFSFDDQMQKMKTDPDNRMLIIAYYWYYKGWTFENRKQYDSALRRELRPAKDLQGFTIKQISSAMEFCSKEYKVWTLETVNKRINDLVNAK
jgi:hypothetical protein